MTFYTLFIISYAYPENDFNFLKIYLTEFTENINIDMYQLFG